jgi:hypothetical protein
MLIKRDHMFSLGFALAIAVSGCSPASHNSKESHTVQSHKSEEVVGS